MDTHVIEELKNSGEQWKELSNWDQIKVPGLHNSMSMSDLVSHLENRISEQRTSNNVVLSSDERHGLEILEEISRCLFSDSQYMPASDEKSLMTRVNSLCCLLQRGDSFADLSVVDRKTGEFDFLPAYASGSKEENMSAAAEGEMEDVSGCKLAPSMSRKDSVGDLLLNLPRIASLPQFLFNISEDIDNQAR